MERSFFPSKSLVNLGICDFCIIFFYSFVVSHLIKFSIAWRRNVMALVVIDHVMHVMLEHTCVCFWNGNSHCAPCVLGVITPFHLVAVKELHFTSCSSEINLYSLFSKLHFALWMIISLSIFALWRYFGVEWCMCPKNAIFPRKFHLLWGNVQYCMTAFFIKSLQHFSNGCILVKDMDVKYY